jgi:hypothetical protein
MPPALEVAGGTSTSADCGQSQSKFPYDLPSPGHAVAIGTNHALDVKPPSHTDSQWAYSLFNSYGSGTYMADYSVGGAYILAGTGGHAHPPNLDAALFDFADATWKRIPNSNGVPQRPDDYAADQSTGTPYFEVPNSSVPIPAHPYRNLAPISSAHGGGDRGSVCYVTRAAVTRSAYSSQAAHRFDLATGRWSRATEDLMPVYSSNSTVESDSVVDDLTGRIFWFPKDLQYVTHAAYYDPIRRGVFKTRISAPEHLGSGYPSAFMHPGLRLLVHHRAATMQVLHVDQPNSFRRITVDGLAESPAGQPGASANAFCYFPPTGNFYWIPRTGGSLLTRLVPPDGNALSGVWRVDSTSIAVDGSNGLPEYGTPGGTNHYRSLFYAEKLDSLAWIPGDSKTGDRRRVYLVRPAV